MEVKRKPEIIIDHGSGHRRIRAVVRCPECGGIGEIDHEQFRGEVSMNCPKKDCTFHETIDFRD